MILKYFNIKYSIMEKISIGTVFNEEKILNEFFLRTNKIEKIN